MFTLDDIAFAQSHIKSGMDFPRYIQHLTALGVARYTTNVADGSTDYFDASSNTVPSPLKYPSLQISNTPSLHAFQRALKTHQQGQSDFMEFCHACATHGVAKWTVDTKKLLCTYYDRSGTLMLREAIPAI